MRQRWWALHLSGSRSVLLTSSLFRSDAAGKRMDAEDAKISITSVFTASQEWEKFLAFGIDRKRRRSRRGTLAWSRRRQQAFQLESRQKNLCWTRPISPPVTTPSSNGSKKEIKSNPLSDMPSITKPTYWTLQTQIQQSLIRAINQARVSIMEVPTSTSQALISWRNPPRTLISIFLPSTFLSTGYEHHPSTTTMTISHHSSLSSRPNQTCLRCKPQHPQPNR